MSHHPRRRASRCRTRGGVFGPVEEHASVQTRVGIDGFTGDKVEKLASLLSEILLPANGVDA